MKADGEVNVGSVRIEKIRVAGKHGVSAVERQSYNTLEVTLEVWADVSKAQHTDNLDDTINYSQVHKHVLEVVRTTSFKLLECLVNAIINKLFEDQRIQAAMVTIAKPERLEGATPSVTIFRNAAQPKKIKQAKGKKEAMPTVGKKAMKATKAPKVWKPANSAPDKRSKRTKRAKLK
jgi:dihydroneopterin aldolase